MLSSPDPMVFYIYLQGHWRGIWWGGRQHGLQLWCRTDAEGCEVEATPFLFNLDVKVGVWCLLPLAAYLRRGRPTEHR